MKQLWSRPMHLLGLVLLCGLAASGQALAETRPTRESSSASAADAAREKFVVAYAHAERQEWSLAREAYAEAFALYPHATTLFNLGYCRAQLGDLIGAWFEIARALASDEFEATRRLSSERRTQAEQQLEALAARLAVLQLPESAAFAQLRVNGEAPTDVGFLEPGTLLSGSPAVDSQTPSPLQPSARRVYVNPGHHEVALTRGEHSRFQEVTLAEGQAFELAELEVEPPAPAVAGVASKLPARAPTPTDRKALVVPSEPPAPVAEPRPMRSAGIVALATAGAGFGLALGAGIVAARTDQHLDEVCDADHSCPPAYHDDVDRYRTAAYLTYFGVALGAAGTLTGVSLLWMDHEQRRSASLAVSPNGVRFTTRF